MANRRMIHRKIWDCEQFISLPIRGRLLYIGTVTLADDYGYFRMDAIYLRRKIFPEDKITPSGIQKLTDQLVDAGLVCRHAKNTNVGIHPNWKRYQTLRPDRPKVSDFPDIPGDLGVSPDIHRTPQDKGTEEKLTQENIEKDKPVSNSSVPINDRFSEIGAQIMKKARNKNQP